MFLKNTVVFCFLVASFQNIAAQCIGAGFNADGLLYGPANALAWEASAGPCAAAMYGPYVGAAAGPYAGVAVGPYAGGLAAYSPAGLAASNGGGLAVTSASPIAPTGIAMTSENAYEGLLAVTGALPFLAAVSLEGVLPTAGSGAVSYGCGNGNVGMISEDIASIGINAGPVGYPGEIGFGYNRLGAPLGYEVGVTGPAYDYNAAVGLGACGGVFYK